MLVKAQQTAKKSAADCGDEKYSFIRIYIQVLMLIYNNLVRRIKVLICSRLAVGWYLVHTISRFTRRNPDCTLTYVLRACFHLCVVFQLQA